MKDIPINYGHLCYECDPDIYPKGKPIFDDKGAIKDSNTGKWICSDCQSERINKGRIKRLGVNHPDVQGFIKTEERKVLKHNDAARRLNKVSGQHLMSYKRNRYTNSMPLSPSTSSPPTERKIVYGERATYHKDAGLQHHSLVP